MKIYEEKSIKDFKFWAGASEFAKRLTDDEWEILEDHFNGCYPDGILDTELNDCFWFDDEILLEIIGADEDEFWDRVSGPFFCKIEVNKKTRANSFT